MSDSEAEAVLLELQREQEGLPPLAAPPAQPIELAAGAVPGSVAQPEAEAAQAAQVAAGAAAGSVGEQAVAAPRPGQGWTGLHVAAKAAALPMADIREAVIALLAGKDLNAISVKGIRRDVAEKFYLPPDALDERRGEIKDMMQQIVQDLFAGRMVLVVEDIGEEDTEASKMYYLVTLPHPQTTHAQDGTQLKPPSSYTRKEIVLAFLATVAGTNSRRVTPLHLEKMCVFRERHANTQLHDHVALKGERNFRFAPLKRYLLEHYGLASHWSCTHERYARQEIRIAIRILSYPLGWAHVFRGISSRRIEGTPFHMSQFGAQCCLGSWE